MMFYMNNSLRDLNQDLWLAVKLNIEEEKYHKPNHNKISWP